MELIYKQEFASYNGSVENADLDDIQDVLDGDKAAFERLIRRYQGQIARLCRRFSRDNSVCQRLVQDTFVEAFISLKSYKAKAPFLHWLKKIATRSGYRYWKERDRQKQFLSLSAFSETLRGEEFDFAQKNRDEEIEPAKAAEILHTLLDRLPAADRLVLTLMYFEDCPIKEIAQRMGWTAAAVKMRALRARKKIKKLAEKENLLEKLEWMQ